MYAINWSVDDRVQVELNIGTYNGGGVLKIDLIKAVREWGSYHCGDVGLKLAKYLVELQEVLIDGVRWDLHELLDHHPYREELAEKILSYVPNALIATGESLPAASEKGIDLTKYTLNQLYGENGILKKTPVVAEIQSYPVEEHPFFD
jgi:hypothetical protein